MGRVRTGWTDPTQADPFYDRFDMQQMDEFDPEKTEFLVQKKMFRPCEKLPYLIW
jgi:hypothetical protein